MTVAAAPSTRTTQRQVAHQQLAQPPPLVPPAVPPGPLWLSLHRRAPSAANPAMQPSGPNFPTLPRWFPNRAAVPAMQQAHVADHVVLPHEMPSCCPTHATKRQAQHLPSRGGRPCTATRRSKPYAQERNSRGQQLICPSRGREGTRRHLSFAKKARVLMPRQRENTQPSASELRNPAWRLRGP